MTTLLNYKIIKKIGSGGMGDVYLAEHSVLKNKVAIKSLHPTLVGDETFRKRFRKEAKTQWDLSHPNIVKLIDFQEQDDGLFLIMEYVEGKQLNDYISDDSGPIPEDKLIPLFTQILSAIKHAHSKGLVHRDIKPANILITPDGNAKVLDFGIAQLSSEDSGLTKTGVQVGTVSYMSPEQVNAEKVDKLSDIYSLGVTLFQMAVGKAPYAGQTNQFKIQLSIVSNPFPKAKDHYPSVSDKLEAIIEKATQKKKEDRFQSCDEFIESFKVNTPIVNKDQTKSIKKTESKTKEVSNKKGHITHFGHEIEKTKNYILYGLISLMIFGLVGYVIDNQQNQNTKKQNQLEEIRLEAERKVADDELWIKKKTNRACFIFKEPNIIGGTLYALGKGSTVYVKLSEIDKSGKYVKARRVEKDETSHDFGAITEGDEGWINKFYLVSEGEELEKESITGAEMTFDETSHDFGAITEGDVVYRSFYFKNTGKSDLLIVDARGSCGCIVPKFPKNVPIAPGEKGEILVSFDSNNKPNLQQKTVTISANTASGRETLRIKAMVNPDPNKQIRIQKAADKRKAEANRKAADKRKAADENIIKTETYIDGSYTGQYKNGLRHGKGKFTSYAGSVYEGDWVNDKMTGKGKMTFNGGSVYEGDFVNNKRTGKGKFTYFGGSVYEGDWVNSEMTGKGKYTWDDGSWYEGIFKNNEKNGIGKYYKANSGKIERQKWRDGKQIR